MRRGYSTLTLLVAFVALGSYVYFVELERPPASELPPLILLRLVVPHQNAS